MMDASQKQLLIAGPCSLENEAVCRSVAEKLTEIRSSYNNLDIIFKGSYDKANRTCLSSQRGPGLQRGLSLLRMVKEDYDFQVTTDVHLPDECAQVAKICDILQIPAFLCRQTELLKAAAQTRKIVNVKKGQFLSPFEMEFVVQKLSAFGAHQAWQTERGTFFGYHNLVVDMRVFEILKKWSQPVIFDATHSTQLPGAASGASSGQREYALPLAKAALAAGASGLFVETHPKPEAALSDKATQIPLSELPQFIQEAYSSRLKPAEEN
jgi:2-dehydro-3-deoxyphosphooctonate aldolase (KDO 8-P synthase)